MESNWRRTVWEYPFPVNGTTLAARFLADPRFCLGQHPTESGPIAIFWEHRPPAELAFALHELPKLAPHFPYGYGTLLEPD